MYDISSHILDLAQNSVRAGARNVMICISEESGLFRVSVEDDGCGIPAETIPRLADPFFTTRSTRRTGLGIPLLKQAAEMTGGNVIIESCPGKGTRVSAAFVASHIDCPPLGDVADVFSLLFYGNPDMNIVLEYMRNSRCFLVDSSKVRDFQNKIQKKYSHSLQALKSYIKSGINCL